MRPGCRRSEASGGEGFILVTVLMISTLLLSSAVSFAWFARQEMRRAAAEEFALVSRSLAQVALYTVSEWIGGDENAYDSELEIIYNPKIPLVLPFDDWYVVVGIVPQNRLLSINKIFLPDGVTMRHELEYPWEEIWTRIGNDDLKLLVLDFLDTNDEARPGSKEEDYYVNRAIGDLSELLRLEDMTPALLYQNRDEPRPTLDQYFTVYGGDKINVNLAPREVLAILDKDIGTDVADSIITYRNEAFIANEKDLIKIPGFPVSATSRLKGIIDYKSNYFLVELKVVHFERERTFSVMLSRSGNVCHIEHWRE